MRLFTHSDDIDDLTADLIPEVTLDGTVNQIIRRIIASARPVQVKVSGATEACRAAGPVVAIAHRELPEELADRTIVVPKSEDELDPILMSVPLQILAYHAAVALERDVDKPRNLAKSVTVE